MSLRSTQSFASASLLFCTLSLAATLLGCGDDPSPSVPCCDAGSDDGGPDDSGPDACRTCEAFDVFERLADPDGPALLLPGRAQLASSREVEPASGFGNRDWGNFVRRDGNRSVLLEESGAGVVTRIWFTMTSPPPDPTRAISDDQRLHVEVDGLEVLRDERGDGVPLGVLTSGTHPAFPPEWVAGRARASGAQMIWVPIAYSRSIRISLEHDAAIQVYYQIDWTALDDGVTPRRAFDGTLDEREREHLRRAEAQWVERSTEGASDERRELSLAPFGSGSVAVGGRGVARSIELVATRGAVDELELTLHVDGSEIASGPASRWLGMSETAGEYGSAMTERASESLRFRLPVPFESSLELEVTSTSEAGHEVEVVVAYDSSARAGLGRLRVDCREPTMADHSMMVSLPMIEVDGARGQYVGQLLTMRGAGGGWWMLEGDHEVAVDGEYTVLGTGVEDYFGGSYYYQDGAFTLPFTGAPGFDLMGSTHLGAPEVDVAMYRFHLLDAIPFSRSFRFEYENTFPGSVFEICSYWYQH